MKECAVDSHQNMVDGPMIFRLSLRVSVSLAFGQELLQLNALEGNKGKLVLRTFGFTIELERLTGQTGRICHCTSVSK